MQDFYTNTVKRCISIPFSIILSFSYTSPCSLLSSPSQGLSLSLSHNPPPYSSCHSTDIDQGQTILSNLVTFIQCVLKKIYFWLLQQILACSALSLKIHPHSLLPVDIPHIHKHTQSGFTPLQCDQLWPFRGGWPLTLSSKVGCSNHQAVRSVRAEPVRSAPYWHTSQTCAHTPCPQLYCRGCVCTCSKATLCRLNVRVRVKFICMGPIDYSLCCSTHTPTTQCCCKVSAYWTQCVFLGQTEQGRRRLVILHLYDCISFSWCFYPKRLPISAFNREGTNPEQQESRKYNFLQVMCYKFAEEEKISADIVSTTMCVHVCFQLFYFSAVSAACVTHLCVTTPACLSTSQVLCVCVFWGWGGTPECHLLSVLWPSTDTMNHWTGGTWGTHTQMATALDQALLCILADTHVVVS